LESNSRKRNCIIGLTQGRIQPVSLGGAISVIFGSQVSLRVHSVKEMKYTSQHCCDKTVDGKMALYRECCFLNCSKIIVKKVTFVGFRRVIAPIALPWIRPWPYMSPGLQPEGGNRAISPEEILKNMFSC